MGRPLKFQTAEQLEKAIDRYFDERVDELNPPTVAGMALFLGFDDRRSLYKYGERPDFFHTIKKAISRIEAYAEAQLYIGKNTTGAIFWLKNHGWKDKTVQDLNVKDFSLFLKNVKERADAYTKPRTDNSDKQESGGVSVNNTSE